MYRDKILQRDWTALYSVGVQGLYMQFTQTLPSLAEVGLACETRS